MMIIIGGKHKKRKLLAPTSTDVRPTASQLRETVFNICQNSIVDANFLDLFAGSGAMGLEALSRGAAHATFIDKGRPAITTIKKNIATLKEESHTTVITSDVLSALKRLTGPFDIIYVDPPYGQGLSTQVLCALDKLNLLVPGGLLFIEDSSTEEPELQNLKRTKERRVGRATLIEYSLTQ